MTRSGAIAHSVTRGAFYLALEKGAALLSGVAYFALLLRWMGPTKYGIITLALSFAGLATMATGNFEVFLERYAAEYEAQGALRTLRRAHLLALAAKLALGLVAGAALVMMSPMLATQFSTPELTWLLPTLVPIVVFDGLQTTGRATLYGLQQFRWVSALAVCFHVLKTVLVGALWGARQGLPALAIALAALTIAQGIATTAVPLWMLRRAEDPPGRGDGVPRRGLMKAMVGYCTPLLGARVTFMSGQNLGKIVLGKLFDTTQLGYFSFAFQTIERFVELAYTVPSSLLPSLTQLVTRDEVGRLRAVFDQSLRLVSVGACAMSLGLFVFAREVTLVVGSPLFAPAVPLLRILALVPVARTAQQPLTMLFQAMRKPGTVLGLAILKFVTEFGSYFLLVPVIGLAGAGWANLAGAVVSYVAALALTARLMPEGAAERTGAALRCAALLLPLLGIALWIDARVGGAAGLALRVALVPAGILGVFALGLVNRLDIEKIALLHLKWAWLRRSRDSFVVVADRFARAVATRRMG